MGLLDSVIGAFGASQAGGTQPDPLQVIGSLLGQTGGLGGLLQKLQQGGLGEAVGSWISTGANQPVTPGALGDALGPDAVAGLARQFGIDPQDALSSLSQMLPQVVDKLSPDGRLPEGAGAGGLGDLAGMLGGLLGRR